ncbi:hypothetical protein Pint_28695 [Pistacia integerrima]|uniref:Uncharacterized protein n=1 Tax=Pistacia integerrima TaxID=434235 RepID=A0ACC0YTI1_9ROSI|nr:hypothetical protein Pint_28695 [Pistacia integerrima]
MATFAKAKDRLLSRFESLTWIRRFNHTLQPQISRKVRSDSVTHKVDVSNWRRTDARKLGIYSYVIPQPSWIVLKILRYQGFQSYLVGGCVRDLLLNKTPKDFDVITTANLQQVRKQFHRCEIVGRRFPICRVHIKDSVIEVSSFETVAHNAEGKEKFLLSQAPRGCDEKDLIRWRNSMHRDFTINRHDSTNINTCLLVIQRGLWWVFLSFVTTVFQHLEILIKWLIMISKYANWKTVCNPCRTARILRGLRIAARLGMSFSKDTETAIRKLSSSVERLDKFRIMMEMNYMMSYGAAEPSICLLQRYNLLKTFLPFHAAYLDEQASETPAENSLMLMKMLSNLDKLVSCDQPADCTLWVGLLAFHQALVSNPQDAFVIWAFASVLYNGKWEEGVKFAREHAKDQVNFAPEISGFSEIESDHKLAAKVTELASLVQHCVNGLTFNETHSSMVFVPKNVGQGVGQIFDVLVNPIESYNNGRKSFMIDYYLLGKGDIPETRFVLGKIILKTISGGLVGGEREKKTKSLLDSFVESCHPRPCDLTENEFLSKKYKERSLAISDSESNMERTKKLKLSGKKSRLFERTLNMNKQDKVSKEESHQKGKELRNLVRAWLLAKEETKMTQENISEKNDCHSSLEVVISKRINKHKNVVKEKNSSRLPLSNLKILGNINLKTIIGGLLGGEREVDEEKKTKSLLDSVEESCHLKPCDLTKNTILSKKNRNHSLAIPYSESNLEKTKKQKLSGKKRRVSEQELNMNKQDEVSKEGSHQKGKEHQNLVETCQLAKEETKMTPKNISGKKDCHSSLEEVISKKINKCKNVAKEKNSSQTKKTKSSGKKRRVSEQELNMNKQDEVSKEESHQKGKKHRNLVDTCQLAKKETKRTQENISEKKDCHSALDEVISKKINKRKNVVKDKNSSETKKTKSSGKKSRVSEQELNMNKQDKNSSETKKMKSSGKKSRVSEQELNMNKQDKSSSETKTTKSSRKKSRVSEQELYVNKQDKSSSETKKTKSSGKKSRVSEQELNVNKQDEVSKEDSHQKGKELQNFVETCLLGKEETKMTQENISEKKDCHSSLEEFISEKKNKHKNVVKEKNSSRPPLSSLFR